MRPVGRGELTPHATAVMSDVCQKFRKHLMSLDRVSRAATSFVQDRNSWNSKEKEESIDTKLTQCSD